MALTDRQTTAQRLTRELQGLGATVTNVLPLADESNLRFWVSDYKKGQVLTALADAGYGEPVFLGMSPQVDVATYSMGLVNNFELVLPAERQPVAHDPQIITGELASSAPKSDYETEQVMRYLGWPPSQKRR
jgi:hypothetical protein